MENIATSVRITAAANALLSNLADKTGKSKAQIVEEALRDWDDRIFWAEVQSAFAAAPESEELRRERQLWENTAADGFERPRPKRKSGSRTEK